MSDEFIPADPRTLLRREQLAAALTAAGYRISAKTLATKATRGGGPRYRVFGKRALYMWGESLAWAESVTSAPRSSTSELNRHAA